MAERRRRKQKAYPVKDLETSRISINAELSDPNCIYMLGKEPVYIHSNVKNFEKGRRTAEAQLKVLQKKVRGTAETRLSQLQKDLNTKYKEIYKIVMGHSKGVTTEKGKKDFCNMFQFMGWGKTGSVVAAETPDVVFVRENIGELMKIKEVSALVLGLFPLASQTRNNMAARNAYVEKIVKAWEAMGRSALGGDLNITNEIKTQDKKNLEAALKKIFKETLAKIGLGTTDPKNNIRLEDQTKLANEITEEALKKGLPIVLGNVVEILAGSTKKNKGVAAEKNNESSKANKTDVVVGISGKGTPQETVNVGINIKTGKQLVYDKNTGLASMVNRYTSSISRENIVQNQAKFFTNTNVGNNFMQVFQYLETNAMALYSNAAQATEYKNIMADLLFWDQIVDNLVGTSFNSKQKRKENSHKNISVLLAWPDQVVLMSDVVKGFVDRLEQVNPNLNGRDFWTGRSGFGGVQKSKITAAQKEELKNAKKSILKGLTSDNQIIEYRAIKDGLEEKYSDLFKSLAGRASVSALSIQINLNKTNMLALR